MQMEKEVLRRAGLAAVAEEKQREDALRAVAWTSATCFVAKTAAVGDAAARAIAAVRRPPPPPAVQSLSLRHCRSITVVHFGLGSHDWCSRWRAVRARTARPLGARGWPF